MNSKAPFFFNHKEFKRTHAFCGCFSLACANQIFNAFLFFLILVFSSNNVSGQQHLTDSLEKELNKNPHDTIKLELLNAIIENISADSLWMPFNEKMGAMAQQLIASENPKIKSAALIALAAFYNNKGYYLENKADIPKALDNYYKSLELHERAGNKTGIATVLNNIGAIKDRLGDDKQALEMYSRSLAIMQQLNDDYGKAQAMSNIGTVYDNQNKTDSALYYYLQSLKFRQVLDDKEGIGITMSNIGGIYDKTGNDSLALRYYTEALQLQVEIDDQVGIALSNISIGNIYFKQKQFAIAEKYFLSSMNMAIKLGNIDNLRGAANFLSKVYAAQGKYKEAYAMHVRFKQLADSINNDANRNAAMQMQARYEYEKKEAALKAEQDKKNALAKQEIEKQKLIKLIIGISALIVIGLLAFGFVNFYKQKKESFNRTVEQVNNKALRAQMNPHFIFNSLNSIQNFINANDSENANDYLIKFAKLVRMILENSREQEIELGKDLKAVEIYMQLESLRLKHGFDYNIIVNPEVDTENILVPPLIIQPFIENAIWHGLQHLNGRGKIEININKNNDELLIKISDNGVGREASRQVKSLAEGESRKSLGMKITSDRINLYNNIKNVKAFFEIEDLKPTGTLVMLHLPYQEAI